MATLPPDEATLAADPLDGEEWREGIGAAYLSMHGRSKA